ncbi:MAG TPA: hypothetical protein VFU07_07180 [Candidatus Lumbricidophila sp.]|nr:hypothetical protein [Candidatus Lumbricidophila sp.]
MSAFDPAFDWDAAQTEAHRRQRFGPLPNDRRGAFFEGAKWQSEQPPRALTLADLQSAKPGTLVLADSLSERPIVYELWPAGWADHADRDGSTTYTAEELSKGWKFGVLTLIWEPKEQLDTPTPD